MGQMAQRILVIGNCGCGKSTLARQLGQRTGLPVIHLDREYWQPGWVEPDKAEFIKRVEELCQQDRWIIDGNYTSTLPQRLKRADMAIWLDFKPRIYVPRVFKRWISHGLRGQTRPDMAPGCPEKVDIEFLQWVLGWWSKRRPKMMAQWQDMPDHITRIRLKTPQELSEWLASNTSLTSS
ncbi:MAG: DNA topology modulation protein [Alphaproteobacteria bacterium]